MVNIHEILKGYGVEIPSDKKADFDKAISENYKTKAEVDKINEKLTKETEAHKETKQTLDTMTNDFNELKNSNASKGDWEEKYKKLVEENTKRENERAEKELAEQERADFDKYFADNSKEWTNPLIADGYFNKYREAKTLPENKSKMSADLLHELTKDDATAFKTTQPEVILKGDNTNGGNSGGTASIPTIF